MTTCSARILVFWAEREKTGEVSNGSDTRPKWLLRFQNFVKKHKTQLTRSNFGFLKNTKNRVFEIGGQIRLFGDVFLTRTHDFGFCQKSTAWEATFFSVFGFLKRGSKKRTLATSLQAYRLMQVRNLSKWAPGKVKKRFLTIFVTHFDFRQIWKGLTTFLCIFWWSFPLWG